MFDNYLVKNLHQKSVTTKFMQGDLRENFDSVSIG
jgi:hypothetical protein